MAQEVEVGHKYHERCEEMFPVWVYATVHVEDHAIKVTRRATPASAEATPNASG
jgi:hypothetical protein